MSTGTAKNNALWNRPGFLVRRLHQICVAIFLDECAGTTGLTPIQWGILTIVDRAPGMGYTMIGEEVGLDKSNTANVVRRLTERGWLHLEPSAEDGRMMCVTLTADGRKLLANLGPHIRQSQDRLFAPLSKSERQIFITLLRRLIVHNNHSSRAPLRMDKAIYEDLLQQDRL